jgi:hypothetical protein
MKKFHDNPNRYRYDLNNASSATDYTGLIPVPPQSEAEREAYEAIYHDELSKPEQPDNNT